MIRVSPEMRKLLDDERNWFGKNGVQISLVEASRIIANRAKDRKDKREEMKSLWGSELGIK